MGWISTRLLIVWTESDRVFQMKVNASPGDCRSQINTVQLLKQFQIGMSVFTILISATPQTDYALTLLKFPSPAPSKFTTLQRYFLSMILNSNYYYLMKNCIILILATKWIYPSKLSRCTQSITVLGSILQHLKSMNHKIYCN
jgi:hypothetical protein